MKTCPSCGVEIRLREEYEKIFKEEAPFGLNMVLVDNDLIKRAIKEGRTIGDLIEEIAPSDGDLDY